MTLLEAKKIGVFQKKDYLNGLIMVLFQKLKFKMEKFLLEKRNHLYQIKERILQLRMYVNTY